jgi:hypothetical protein
MAPDLGPALLAGGFMGRLFLVFVSNNSIENGKRIETV